MVESTIVPFSVSIRNRSDSLQPWQKTSRGCRSGSTDCGTFLSCLRPESDCCIPRRKNPKRHGYQWPHSARPYRTNHTDSAAGGCEHQFKLLGLISVLPLVIVRPDQLLQLFSRHNPLDPFQQYFLVRADFFQFVVKKRHAHLLVHVLIIALFCPVFNVFVLRGDALSKKPVISRVSCIKNCWKYGFKIGFVAWNNPY